MTGTADLEPAAIELAALLSPAVQIEPALMRAVRLQHAPHLDAAAEADLWFSDLVEVRGPDAIVLFPEAAEQLRQQLRGRYADEPEVVRAAWSTIRSHHAELAPALALEEAISWLTIEGGDIDAMEDALASALVALVHEERRGIAEWAVGALRRLPPAARRTTAAWLLTQAARPHLETPPQSVGPPPPGASAQLAEIVSRLDSTALGARRRGGTLELGDVDLSYAAGMRVPDTEPRVVDVMWEAPDGPRSVEVHIASGATVEVAVGLGRVRVRAADGTLYTLDEAASDDEISLLEGACLELSVDGRSQTGFAVEPGLIASHWPEASPGYAAKIMRGGSAYSVTVERIEGAIAYLRADEPLEGARTLTLSTLPRLDVGVRWASYAFRNGHPVVYVGRVAAKPAEDRLAQLETRLPPGLHADALRGSPVVVDGQVAAVMTHIAAGHSEAGDRIFAAPTVAHVERPAIGTAFSPEFFVDRVHEQELFERLLDFESDARVLAVSADAGEGKSHLLEMFRYRCQLTRNVPVALLRLDEFSTAYQLVRAIVRALRDFGVGFPRFEEVEKSRVESSVRGVVHMDQPNVQGTVAGVHIENLYVGEPDSELADRQRQASLQAFVDDIRALGTEQPLALLFDSWDQVATELERWILWFLRSTLFEADPPSPHTAVVIAGRAVPRQRLRAMLGERFVDVVISLEALSLWDPEHIRAYFEMHRLQFDDEDVAWVAAKLKRGWTIGRATDALAPLREDEPASGGLR